MIDIGRLRNLLTLQRRTDASDGAGSLTTTYADVGQVWAEIVMVGATRYAAGQQVAERVTHRITIRWRSSTDFTHLADDSGRRWRVREGPMDPDGRRRELVVFAEELTPEVAP